MGSFAHCDERQGLMPPLTGTHWRGGSYRACANILRQTIIYLHHYITKGAEISAPFKFLLNQDHFITPLPYPITAVEGIVPTLANLGQPSKALSPISAVAFENTTFESFAHLKNAPVPIMVTDERSISLRDGQLAKLQRSISVTAEESFTLSRL